MSRFGRSLQTPLAVVALAQIASTIVHALASQWEESFATMSNLAYIFSGCYHHFYTIPRMGSLFNPAFPLLLLGVSSFSFHGEPQGHLQKHTLDIWAGWVVVLHLACVTASTAVNEILSEIALLRTHAVWTDVGFVVLFSSVALVVSALYTQVYTEQLLLYVVGVVSASVFAFVIRLRLSSCTASSLAGALFEFVATILLGISAVYIKGELVGTQLSYASQPELYDVLHGQWHIQLALVVSLVHVRCADALEQTTQPLYHQDHISGLTLSEISWLATFAVQAVVLFVLKELRAALVSIRVVLWVGSVLHGFHVVGLLCSAQQLEQVEKTVKIRPLVKV